MEQLKARLIGTAAIALMARAAMGASFHIPGGDLDAALNAYAEQSGVQIAVSIDAIKGVRTRGVAGNLSSDIALDRILQGTGLVPSRDPSGIVTIVPGHSSMLSTKPEIGTIQLAQATPQRAAVETVTVTSSKLGGADVQSIPIAITALSQEQLTATQTAGGPDLVKQVPNLTFSKTNFTGYNIQIRGIGTQAISVTTDPGVAVAFNDTPFIHNHFFEQEFYDVSQLEVLRGPQGTLYGRNATAGVVNVVSARPTDQFEAMLSADIGNYKNRRFEAMLNLPIVDDRLALRVAGEWTKRDGYSINDITGRNIDGRDLWSGRASLRWKPTSKITADLIWEHFQENDDRLRSAKQLCDRGSPPATILGQSTDVGGGNLAEGYLNQNCVPASLYSPESFGVPNSLALAYYGGLVGVGFGNALISPLNSGALGSQHDAYASTTQSRNLRVIESTLDPEYRAKNDTLELNAEWQVAPSLKLSSQTGYNHDFLWSIEDFNRFNTQPGIFAYIPAGNQSSLITPDGNYLCYDGTYSAGGNFCGSVGGSPTGYFCDPQLGCSNRLVGEDLSEERSWQFSQELRLTSDFKGPLNFSFGGNYLHYVIDENYYVFFNTLTMFSTLDGLAGRGNSAPWTPGVSYNEHCLSNGYQYANPNVASSAEGCLGYIDPNPLTSLNQQGHNYFLSQNPYRLNSYAMFGEVYYNLTKDVKFTGGLRWTDDQKRFIEIPSELLTQGYGYPSTGALDQEWKEWTGRFVAEWSPQLSFTDQTMLYASYAHGYKAGGANPPGAVLLHYQATDISNPTHPLTFAPEFNDAFELGSKNTLFDGALTLNGDVFYYNYKGYQISEIVDRTSINLNFDATVKGAELQATWEPVPGLKFSFAGGYEHTRLADGSRAIDLMDRTAGNSNWVLVKPFVTQASNCVVPAYVVAYLLNPAHNNQPGLGEIVSLCGDTYNANVDPVTGANYTANPTTGSTPFGSYPIDPTYPGFDPLAGTPGHPYTGQNTYNGIDYGPVPNNGAGFYKDLSGKELPNAPHFTTSFSADYTMPISSNWAATLHGDFYWQAQSWARVINDDPYDRLRGYTNVNLSLILTETSGWQLMGYVKNVFNTTAITGTFLNTDDTGLTTNIFLTDPRLFGVRVTKNFGASGSDFDLFSVADGKLPQLWLTLGGDYAMLGAPKEKYEPQFAALLPNDLPTGSAVDRLPGGVFDWDGKLTLQPEDSDWKFSAQVRYGRSGSSSHAHKSLPAKTLHSRVRPIKYTAIPCTGGPNNATCSAVYHTFSDVQGGTREEHTMLDFVLGKDVGIGLFGKSGTGMISAGIRAAQFTSSADFELNADPMYDFEQLIVRSRWEVYDAKHSEWRSFHGFGPEVTWDAEQMVYGDPDTGALAIDWGVNAALLFGRQKANVRHEATHTSCGVGISNCTPATANTEHFASNRSRRVIVPNIGGYIGASARYRNSKISFGYRADTFFNAMDGGQETAKTYNRGFYGPYLNVSIGLGG